MGRELVQLRISTPPKKERLRSRDILLSTMLEVVA